MQTTKRAKKAISIILAAVMCLSLFTMAVTAADSDFVITQMGQLVRYTGAGGAVVIPDGVISIDTSAFKDCTGLTSVTIPDSVTFIGYVAFKGCTSLTSVTIGNGVTEIGSLSFENCTSLTSVTIGNSVTKIGQDAFKGCTNLTSITIPNSEIIIDNSSFYECPNFSTIYGVSGSYAETYSNNRNLQFIPISEKPTEQPTEQTQTNNPSEWAAADITTAITENIVPQELQASYTQATTRAEFCALAVALYEKVTGAAITERETFNDTTDINIEKAAAIKVVNGIGGGNFNPNASLTREQAAAMLTRLAEAVEKPLTSGAAAFNDNNNISDWAIEAVGAMQASGIMGGVGDNIFDPQGAYTREQSIVTILRLYNALK